jgi:hypothetical protein
LRGRVRSGEAGCGRAAWGVVDWEGGREMNGRPLGGVALALARERDEKRLVREMLGSGGKKRRRRGESIGGLLVGGGGARAATDWGLSALGRSRVRGRLPSLRDEFIRRSGK